ncbi:MAG: BlaI/MecI/CopY family transcriptional regulator [Deltaproteobacteria bacterium]|nr:BlaI/MecI/CopY family transcriptional regulator [Deltaproteobacteria bacterium]
MKGIRFRPEQEGLRAALFDLEADIMEVVWSKGWKEFAVADVQRELERKRDIAYTTVMTTVGRLHEKGLLSRERDGKRYVYRPCMSRDEFTEAMARDLLGSLSGLGHEQAIALLVDQVADSDAEELGKFEALIRKKKKELGG